jgi:hypothetical protein
MLGVLSQIVAIFAVLATAVVYGTDMCAALIMKPAYARLDILGGRVPSAIASAVAVAALLANDLVRSG